MATTLVVGLAIFGIGAWFGLSLCRAAGDSERLEMSQMTRPEALRLLLAKAQREVFDQNGVRR